MESTFRLTPATKKAIRHSYKVSNIPCVLKPIWVYAASGLMSIYIPTTFISLKIKLTASENEFKTAYTHSEWKTLAKEIIHDATQTLHPSSYASYNHAEVVAETMDININRSGIFEFGDIPRKKTWAKDDVTISFFDTPFIFDPKLVSIAFDLLSGSNVRVSLIPRNGLRLLHLTDKTGDVSVLIAPLRRV